MAEPVKKMTLLEKARAQPTQNKGAIKINDDMIELVFAFSNNEVTIGQVTQALELKSAQHAWSIVAKVMQHMVMSGLLVPDGWLKEK